MMRLILLLSALILLVSVPTSPALPQAGIDPAALYRLAEELHQVPLTEDMVSRFVASCPEMKAVGEKFPVTQPSQENGDQNELETVSPEKRKAMDDVATNTGSRMSRNGSRSPRRLP